jgi:hypothetical protein
MAKRFTDTTKWNKPFIRGLQAPYKLLWFYILDDCDHAGIWQVDEDVAKIRIGCEIDFNDAIKIFGNHIQVFDDGQKWFIKDFIDFQYGELNPLNRVHLSIISIHKKYKIKPLTSPLQGAKDKDKDKDMDKEQDKDKETVFCFEEFWEAYPNKVAKEKCKDKFKNLSEEKRQKIKETIFTFAKYKPFETYSHPHPMTYLNQERWDDEIKPKQEYKEIIWE